MKLLVKYLLKVAMMTGKGEETEDLSENSTSENLFRALVERCGGGFKNTFFYTESQLESDVGLLLNGRQIGKHEEQWSEMLSENDTATLIPSVTSG